MLSFPATLKFAVFKTRNAAYQGPFWAKCKALYAGGPALLGNDGLLRQCMPPHTNEAQEVYTERLKRAFYLPYAGSIIDQLVAQLTNKPVTIEPEETTEGSDDGGVSGSEPTEEDLPPYYADLVKNCGRPGGRRCSLNQLAREQILTALQCQTAWTLVDLPPAQPYASLAEQDAAGALNAYVCPIDPECVIDWEEQEDGELGWVLIQDVSARRADLTANRDIVTMRWRYYTADSWAIYEISYDSKKRLDGPSDTDDVVLVDSGTHSFGRVPVRRLALTEGLWAMGKLEAIARAHLNQRNALSWGQLKALFPVPVLYAETPHQESPISEDTSRVNQKHGQGFLRVLAEKDRLEYFSPDSAPYSVAGEDLTHLRDEMYRVLYSMAQSVDNSGAALKRSAESKTVDQAAAAVILRALGVYVREHLEDLLLTISTGRRDNLRFCAKGMDNFDDQTLTQVVTEAVGLETVPIPSATFQQLYKYKLAKLALGPDTRDEDLVQVQKELKSALTQDTYDLAHSPETIPLAGAPDKASSDGKSSTD